ncbi:MAG: hypothetical protein V7724_02245 [Sediminicola sp.]|tara:strand:+ start:107770 stop:108261 length:492 start_codon:yes stop_codon:yes gene_type:complete
MKRKIGLASATWMLLFLACKESPKTEIPQVETVVPAETPIKEEVAEQNALRECYRFTGNNDTITIKLAKKGERIIGTLDYYFYEKDKSTGTLEGHISGDTLFAVYEYTSEGRLSKREVAFLKRGSVIKEGFAEVEEVDGMFRFKDGAVLDFENNVVLNATDCD